MTFGVIIDSSEPTRDEKKGGYITKLKIIDDTFNYKQIIRNDELKFHKFIHIHIRTKDLANAPRIRNIGEIIRLRRFCFSLSQKGELMAWDSAISNWLIYSHGLKENYTSHSYHYIAKNFERENTKYEENRILELRKWINEFFLQNSLKNISWWSALREPVSDAKAAEEKCVEKDVDLILKTENVMMPKNA